MNRQRRTIPINISRSLSSNDMEPPSPLNFSSHSMSYSTSISSNRRLHSIIQEDPAGSSEETGGFDTDPTGDISPPSKAETNSIASSVTDKKSKLTV